MKISPILNALTNILPLAVFIFTVLALLPWGGGWNTALFTILTLENT